MTGVIPKRASGRNPFALTPNEHDWLVMEKLGFSKRDTALIFGVKIEHGHFARALDIAHEKLRASAELQAILEIHCPGPSSLAVAHGTARMVGTR